MNCVEEGVETVYGGGFDNDGWYAGAFSWGRGKPFAKVVPQRLLGGLTVSV